MYKSRVDANEWAIVDSALLQGTLGRLRWLWVWCRVAL